MFQAAVQPGTSQRAHTYFVGELGRLIFKRSDDRSGCAGRWGHCFSWQHSLASRERSRRRIEALQHLGRHAWSSKACRQAKLGHVRVAARKAQPMLSVVKEISA
jgi:hypothetical protein